MSILVNIVLVYCKKKKKKKSKINILNYYVNLNLINLNRREIERTKKSTTQDK